MRPFNLQEALAGKPVITRDGRKVTEIYHLKTATVGVQSVLFIVDGYVESCNTDGRYSTKDCSYDLFMAPESIEVWVNVWRGNDGKVFTTSEEKEPGIIIKTRHGYIKTEKISITL